VRSPRREDLYAEAARHKYLNVAGVSVHIGSQIVDALRSLRHWNGSRPGRELRDHGTIFVTSMQAAAWGFPIREPLHDFRKEISAYAQAVIEPLRGLNVHLLLERGGSIDRAPEAAEEN